MTCEAICVEHHHRWGAFYHRCQLEIGHEGEHMVELDTFVPPARMVWVEPSLVDEGVRS